jgi:G3E family GTPase
MTRVVTHLITGFAGAGKTTLLRTLVAQRPRDEHWALLLNGTGGVISSEGVTVQALTDGCACCTARVTFRTALVQLLRAARPQRLLIELAGIGDPAGVKMVFNEASIARAVALRNTLCVVNAQQLTDPRITAHDSYAAPLRHAGHIILAGNDPGAAAAHLGLSDAAGTPITLMHDAGLSLLDVEPTR